MSGIWVRHAAEGAPVVVFVHGVLSKGETCWQHPEGGFWPHIVADDPALSDVGVYDFSYKTGIFSRAYHLGDAVDSLKEHLKLEGIVTPGGIVFVCHSMGGILVRRYLVSQAAELIERDIPVALFLVASPSLGSTFANWLAPLARLIKHSQAAVLRFSQSNTWLNDLDRDFLNLKEQGRLRLTGKELVEDQPPVLKRWWGRQVVEPFSGARYFSDPIKIAYSDHSSIAKIANGDAFQHRLLRQFILDWRARLGVGASGAPERAELVGIVPVEAGEERERRARELAAASAELLAWPTSLPDGEQLERPELASLVERVSETVSSTTAIIGAAGSGKSALLATVAHSFIDAGWPVLAIKADLIEPDVVSEDMLRERLGLDRQPSDTLRELARFGPVLLVIDQLDALAGHLDVKTMRLSVLLNLVRAIGGTENVHVVLSSRPFEFQHDVRLRAVGAESLDLELPSWEDVLAVLEKHDVAAAGWPSDAQEVMRFPQALTTYLQLGGSPDGQPFASYQMMLERLWTERVLKGEHGGALDRLASDVADAMAEQESLWLGTARFADRAAELQTLVAAGILKIVEASVGFSHQTLFEFALARSQAREPGRLSRLARDRQSSLFLRPKLWAALTYLRAADPDLYYGELEAVWRLDVRPHLRALLIDFLGSQSDPTDREAILMDAALAADATRLRAYKAVTGSIGWFARLADSHVATAMTGEESIANAQIAVLTEALKTAPAKVAELIRERWLPNPAHDVRTWAVMQWSSPWTNEALSIVETAIARTDLAITMIDHQAATAAVEQPEAALRLVRAKLDRDLDRGAAEKDCSVGVEGGGEEVGRRLLDRARDPLRNMIERGDDWDGLPGIAETWPSELIHALWPWFTRALAELERSTDRDRYLGYALPFEADFRFERESTHGLQEGAVLGALRIAVEGLADRDPEAFRHWASENDGVALTAVQRLIAHGIAHRPETFAADGLAFVLSDERRYFLGSIQDMHGTIKRMVSAVSPFWSATEVQAFEARVRAFAPPPPAEKTDPQDRMRWRHMVRQTQLDLLRSLPKQQRSPAAAKQVQEDERRYGTEPRGATFSGPLAVGSIIEAEAMPGASDKDIVNAFVELPDAVGWDNPRRLMAGGNIQLARAFADFARADPVRALRIVGMLDASNGVRAAAYALDALSEAGDPDTVSRLARDAIARHFDSEEFRQLAARSLGRLARRGAPVPDDLIAQLEAWLDAPLPSRGEEEDERDERDEQQTEDGDDAASAEPEAAAAEEDIPEIERSLLWGYGGGGAYPGGVLPVADELVHIRLSQGQAKEAVDTMSRFLEREKGIRQWEVLSRHFQQIAGAATGAGDALIEAVLSTVPGVVGSQAFARFLAYAQKAHHGLVERHLNAWRDSGEVLARQAYGEIVALDAMLRPEREDSRRRFDELIGGSGSPAAQFGAALTAAHVLAETPDRRVEAARALVALLALPNVAVWPAAFEFFRLADRLVPDEGTVAFLRAVADGVHRSDAVDPTFVIDALATLLPHEAGIVSDIALALTEKWKGELADMRTATARATSALVDLAVTLHRLGPDTRDVGLQLFEQLIDIDAYEARQTLEEIDGRFRENAPTFRRRRVRRRSQVLPRRRRDAGAEG